MDKICVNDCQSIKCYLTFYFHEDHNLNVKNYVKYFSPGLQHQYLHVYLVASLLIWQHTNMTYFLPKSSVEPSF